MSDEMAHQLKQHVVIGETCAGTASILIMVAAIAVGVAAGSPSPVNTVQNLGSLGAQPPWLR
jgi:uncharacterized spore protein YtfJ